MTTTTFDPIARTARDLGQRLRAVFSDHDLRRSQLLATQRGIVGLARSGLAPTANEFWDSTARPRAAVLVSCATDVIEEELTALEGRTRSTGDRTRLGLAAVDLIATVPDRQAINDLGRWWQRRLRRAAVARALPRLASTTPREADLVIATAEMALLDRPPWSHGDRLLSAYELAHAEVERFALTRAEQVVAALTAQPGV